MAKKEKTPPKKPAINSYWLYASIILFFIGMSFFGGIDSMSSDQKINISTFENYLNDGEISKVVVINKKTAKVTLTETALTETKHIKATKKDLLRSKNSSGPHYQFEIGNLELFQKINNH